MRHAIVVVPAAPSADGAGVRVSSSKYPSIDPSVGGLGLPTDGDSR